jgi:hypothetical protein
MNNNNNKRVHDASFRWAIIKKQVTRNADKDVGESNSIHCWWECKLVQPLWKSV